MEQVIRYDFSFPPKSSSLNSSSGAAQMSQQPPLHHSNYHHQNNNSSHSHQQQQHQNHQQHQQHQHQARTKTVYSTERHYMQQPPPSSSSIGLCKSASTSLLSCAVLNSNLMISNINNNNCFHNNNNNITGFNNNNNFNKIHGQPQSCCDSCNSNKFKSSNNADSTPIMLMNLMNNAGNNKENAVLPPQTPKDSSNCSFTFDELKNTLAFMEDSPLVINNNNNNNNNNKNSINNNNKSEGVLTKCLVTDELVVIPTCGGVANESSSSSMLSSTSLSSSGSSASSSSSSFPNQGQSTAAAANNNNNQCGVGNQSLPKSTSNPLLLCAAATVVPTTASATSPSSSSTSSSSSLSRNDCSCTANKRQQQQQQQQLHHEVMPTNSSSNSSMMMMRKSPSSSLIYDKLSSKLLRPSVLAKHTNTRGVHMVNGAGSIINNQNTAAASMMMNNNNNYNGINTAVENAAKKYRCAAQVSEASCCWKGKLPPKQYKIPIVYSNKVFVGGLPWDITEDDLCKEFGVFGPCRVEWTNKEKFNLLNSNNNQLQQQHSFEMMNNGGSSSSSSFRSHRSASSLMMMNSAPHHQQHYGQGQSNHHNQDPLNASKQRQSPGFAYVIYDNEYSVRSLVGNCIEDYQNGRDRVEYFFKISTRRVRNKEVQIIPWILADNNYALCTPKELDPKKTVFVGNLHGTMTARDLAHIMNELFGCVVYAGIDIDKLKYPIGSGRVTFSQQQNFMRAVRAAFVDIKSAKFSKRIQIDPYLEDVQCCICHSDKGMYFCRDFHCFNYYCGGCWEKQHSFNQQMGNHKPLMRKREDK